MGEKKMTVFEAYYQRELNQASTRPLPYVELPLYRYRSNPNNYLDEIKNEYVYLAPLDSLNDPFDCAPAISYDEMLLIRRTRKDFLSACYFLNDYSSIKRIKETAESQTEEISLDEFSNWLSDEMKKGGETYPVGAISKNYYHFGLSRVLRRSYVGRVACFSEVGDSLPMWGYYANSHKGICIKYDFSLLDYSDNNNVALKYAIQKVWYSKNRYPDKNNSFVQFMKASEWAHEQEWRLFENGTRDRLFLPCISAIYMGLNFDLDYLEPLVEILQKKPRKIELFSMRPSQDTYSLIPTKINY